MFELIIFCYNDGKLVKVYRFNKDVSEEELFNIFSQYDQTDINF